MDEDGQEYQEGEDINAVEMLTKDEQDSITEAFEVLEPTTLCMLARWCSL